MLQLLPTSNVNNLLTFMRYNLICFLLTRSPDGLLRLGQRIKTPFYFHLSVTPALAWSHPSKIYNEILKTRIDDDGNWRTLSVLLKGYCIFQEYIQSWYWLYEIFYNVLLDDRRNKKNCLLKILWNLTKKVLFIDW